jgi:DNA-binding transcriptional MerR regulator
MAGEHLLRIGELSRRTGVSPETLRAWERRYQLFEPRRTEGGFRLYSASDVARIVAMKQLLAEGVSASEAAQRVMAEPAPTAASAAAGEPSLIERRARALRDAMLAYDEAGANRLIDELLMELDADTVMQRVFLPLLREIGELWEQRAIGVAEEHFASNLIRRRLSSFARGWEDGVGPRALLACPEDEEHDIPLLMFGIALGRRGWRITYLGPRTPTSEVVRAIEAIHPEVVVVASPREDALRALVAPLSRVSGGVRVAIGGAGATPDVARRMGALLLDDDPVSAAARVASHSLSGADSR